MRPCVSPVSLLVKLHIPKLPARPPTHLNPAECALVNGRARGPHGPKGVFSGFSGLTCSYTVVQNEKNKSGENSPLNSFYGLSHSLKWETLWISLKSFIDERVGSHRHVTLF